MGRLLRCLLGFAKGRLGICYAYVEKSNSYMQHGHDLLCASDDLSSSRHMLRTTILTSTTFMICYEYLMGCLLRCLLGFAEGRLGICYASVARSYSYRQHGHDLLCISDDRSAEI